MEVWQSISCSRKSIQLLPVLVGGQSFRWKCTKEDNYIGVFKNLVWELIQTDNEIKFKTHGKQTGEAEVLRQYLRLDEDLDKLYKTWSEKDPDFKEVGQRFYGIRMLRQDVIENVFSFICSSNNNITRITSLVEKLCNGYGAHIATVDNVAYHSFPEVAALAEPKVEAALREAGFGYRAAFIHKSAISINTIGEEKWIDYIKNQDYRKAKQELVSLQGVGPKVADCICLMSLGHMQAVPVDTHILQIAGKKFLPHLKNKRALTDKVSDEIGDYFRNLYGPYAGWAQTILFCDDLKAFQGQKRSKQKNASVKRKKKTIDEA